MNIKLYFCFFYMLFVLPIMSAEKYEVIANNKLFHPKSLQEKEQISDNQKVLEIKNFKTNNAEKIRFFVKIATNDTNDTSLVTREVRISFYHNHPSGSTQICSETIRLKNGEGTKFINLNIYGESMKIIVWDVSLEQVEHQLTITAYRNTSVLGEK